MRARLIVAWAVMAASLAVFLPVEPAGAAEDIGDITTFTAANVNRPYEITLGPDRNLWFTSRDTDRIGRITVNGTITLFAGQQTLNGPASITSGPDGRLWFTLVEGNRIGRMTTTGTSSTFTNAGLYNPQDLVEGPDGAIWFTNQGDGRLGRITTAGVVTFFSHVDLDENDVISRLVVGPDGNLWFGAFKDAALWRFDPGPNTFTKFPTNGAGAFGARQMTLGPDGRIWFAAQISDSIAVIDPMAGNDTAIQNSLANYTDPNTNVFDPQGITSAADGNIWFTTSTASRVGFLDPDAPNPATTITTFTDPGGNIDEAFTMATGPDGHPWFTIIGDDRIGQVRASNCNTAPFPHGFTDVAPAIFYEDGVDWAKCHDLVSGFPDNTYHPDEPVNRGQIVSILWVMMGSPGGSPPHGFPDIPNNVFYEQALRWAKAEGLVTGFPNGQYKPKDPVNRCQITNMMWQLVGTPGPYPTHPYTDVTPASFCNDAIDWAYANELWDDDIVSGTTFLPKAGATRAQVADLLYELASVGDAWDEFVGTFPDTVRFPT